MSALDFTARGMVRQLDAALSSSEAGGGASLVGQKGGGTVQDSLDLIIRLVPGPGPNDNTQFLDALAQAEASGARMIHIVGTIRLADMVITDFSGDVEVVGGTILFAGVDQIMGLYGGTGKMAFRGVTFDGGGAASQNSMLWAVSDQDLTITIDGGEVRQVGSSINATGGFLRVTNARGWIRGVDIHDVHAPLRHVIAIGHGAFGAISNRIAHVDGNAIRIGLYGSGSIAEGKSYAISNDIYDVDDSTDGSGPAGNGINMYRIYGHRCIGNRIEKVFGSAIRENQSSGQIIGNRCYDSALIGIYHEFGSRGSVISGNYVFGAGTQGIVTANPENIDPADTRMTVVAGNTVWRIGYLQTYSQRALPASYPGGAGTAYVASADDLAAWSNDTPYTEGDNIGDTDTGQVFRCLIAHTSPASGTFADDRAAQPSYWAEFVPGRQRAHGLTMNFGYAADNTVWDVNACGTGDSVCFATAAQFFNRETMFAQNFGYDADYLVGFGLGSKVYPITIDGVSGTCRIAPFAKLGGSYTIYPATGGAAGEGDNVLIRNMTCPQALRPKDLKPGSQLTDPDTGQQMRFLGASAAGGTWDDGIKIRNAVSQTLDLDYTAGVTRINSASIVTLTVPENTPDIPVGSVVVVIRSGAGAVNIVGGGAATVVGNTSPTRYTEVRLRKLGASYWNAG